MEIKKIFHAPVIQEELDTLKIGDMVYLQGSIFTARDAAHKRMYQLIKEGKPLPIELKDQVIYYAGPCPARPGLMIGSCGPTTSSRMDAYTPLLLEHGLKAMIGKGPRSAQVIEAMVKYGAVYLAAVGGAGALIASCIKKVEIVAFEDLGPEAIYRMEVENMPLLVAIDAQGNNLYEMGPLQFARI
ncbi:fumarate hydratase subunit beta [Caldicoprobacter guelmensis]|uniref:Fe-S-containing hydro-lyase n=1 Tax=Caldicoprobacter guelmensis TaxID=1170224 RepID=UPI00195BE167|nr:Fe-S-containing hydro-lyase [Caldicoprobacter guelmensis]MBM7582506.1 fumarate hydratase subunit beta [Caldicoprobacter guelmensis]